MMINKRFCVTMILMGAIMVHVPFISGKTQPNLPILNKTIALVNPGGAINVNNEATAVYNELNLENLGLSKNAFEYALNGYNNLKASGKLKNDKVLSIVDFTLQSSKKRLFVIDLENKKVLFNTFVAHGRNSGKDYASQFSNIGESYQSSLGFYITKDTYNGTHGFSLRLEGEEKGFNDNALNRAIVMHSAWYVDEKIAKSQGYIGRSQGCPAIPEAFNKPIIETIKNGSCLFLYSADKNYLSHSKFVNNINKA